MVKLGMTVELTVDSGLLSNYVKRKKVKIYNLSIIKTKEVKIVCFYNCYFKFIKLDYLSTATYRLGATIFIPMYTQ